MRSFNANFVTEKNKRANGPAPRNLVKLAFSTPVYLADYTVTPSGGSQHDGLVKSWGFIDSAASQTPGRGILGQFEVPDLQLTIINSTGFSDNFSEAPEGVVVTLYQWFVGLAYSEAEPIFVGMVRGQPEFDLLECKLTIKGIWHKYNRLIGSDLVISAADWPSADPDDIGKSSNIGYGSLTNVPCRALKAGVVDSLRDDLTDVATSFYVSLAGKTNFPSGTVVVQIDQEKIQGTYNQSTGQFTSCTRGYGSTTAVAHDKGATVAEVLTEYVYEIAGHPVKSIGDVRVADVKQTSGYTAYTGQSGDELTGYEGRAVIKFTALPIIKRQVNITATVDEGSHSHSSAEQILVWEFDTATIINSSGVYFPECLCDNDFSTYATLRTNGGQVRLEKAKYAAFAGAPTQYRVCVRTGTLDASVSHTISFGSAAVGINYNSDDSTLKSSWVNVSASQDTWAEFNNIYAYVTCTGTTGTNAKIAEVWVEVKTTPSTNAGAATGVDVALGGNSSADTVIGGQVTVDFDGWQDDASGTITGTANALIERPDHVYKHILTYYCSFPSADIDGSFATSGTFYNTNSYAFSLLIDRPIRASELLARLATQCRSRFFVSPIGKAKLIVRQTGQSSGHSIAKTEIRKGSAKMRRSAADDIINAFTIKYNRDWAQSGPDAYAGATNFSDATSISTYGRREPPDPGLFEFDAVTDSSMVTSVGTFWLTWLKNVRSMPMFHVFLDNCEIEPGDIIDVTHDLDSMSSFVCEVVKVVHVLGSAKRKVLDRLEIQALEN